MISVVKYFILGASKVFDFTNRTRIYEIDYKNIETVFNKPLLHW